MNNLKYFYKWRGDTILYNYKPQTTSYIINIHISIMRGTIFTSSGERPSNLIAEEEAETSTGLLTEVGLTRE